MADLLSSLVLPNSSQESFHSTYSSHSPIQSSPRLSQATATQQTDLTNTCDSSGSGKSSKSEIPTAASSSQAQSHHSLHDIDAYLNDHANKTSPENGSEKNFAPGPSTSTAKSSKASSNGSTLKNSESIQVGGPKSSHHVTLLFQMCQERGLVPEFDIKEDPPMSQQFRGTLTVGGATITLETSEASKKDARQSLAARGCELVRDMSSPKSSGNSTTGTENWVGKLLEFHSLTSTPTTPAPTFTEFNLGSSFASEVTIVQSPTPFGSRTTPHPTKKAAKAAAAQAAITHLISTGYLLPDATISPHHKSAKRARLNPAPKAAAVTTAATSTATPTSTSTSGPVDVHDESAQSWGQRVNALYPLLGLPTPEYRLQLDEGSINFYSGAAYFSGVVDAEGPVGEVRHVVGRRRAREECAKGVWFFLEGLRRRRLGEGELEAGVLAEGG